MNPILVSKFCLHFGQTESVQKMVIFKSSINQVINYANMDIQHHFIEKGQYYHVYALDTRGHGKTPRGDAPFRKIQAKTLVVAGTKDMVKDDHTRLIASHISDAQLVILAGNHFVASKCPEAFNRAVLAFLRD